MPAGLHIYNKYGQLISDFTEPYLRYVGTFNIVVPAGVDKHQFPISDPQIKASRRIVAFPVSGEVACKTISKTDGVAYLEFSGFVLNQHQNLNETVVTAWKPISNVAKTIQLVVFTEIE